MSLKIAAAGAIVEMFLLAAPAFAKDPVDLRDTTCPKCDAPVLREPEPRLPVAKNPVDTVKDPAVERAREQGRRDAEDYYERRSRQQGQQNKN